LKTPDYFRSLGLEPEEALVEILERTGYRSATDPVFLQSFEAASLQRLDRLTDLRLVLLLFRDPDEPAAVTRQTSDAGLAEIARYADGIGVEKYGLVIPKDTEDRLLADQASDLPARAQRAGLAVHAWTFRAENEFLPTNLRNGGPLTAPGDSLAEHRAFIAAGVAGLFTEQPEIAKAACREAGRR
jgi:glycerophosphoryl diester phosphodiesterase